MKPGGMKKMHALFLACTGLAIGTFSRQEAKDVIKRWTPRVDYLPIGSELPASLVSRIYEFQKARVLIETDEKCLLVVAAGDELVDGFVCRVGEHVEICAALWGSSSDAERLRVLHDLNQNVVFHRHFVFLGKGVSSDLARLWDR